MAVACLSAPSTAGASYWRDRPESPFKLKLEIDAPLLLIGLPGWLGTHWIDPSLPPPTCGQPGNLCDRSKVPWFDRPFMYYYPALQPPAEYLFHYAPIVIPAVLLVLDYGPFRLKSFVTDTVILIESLAVAGAVTHIFRYAVRRPRPYLYFDDQYPHRRDTADATMSFWSGHVSELMAFGVAAAYILMKRHNSAAWTVGPWVLFTGLGVATAILRVGSGDHFASDVLAGAMVGVGTGLLVPWLHLPRRDSSAPSVAVTPMATSTMAGLALNGRF